MSAEHHAMLLRIYGPGVHVLRHIRARRLVEVCILRL